MKFMVGIFDDESSFICAQTLDGILLVIKTQEPKSMSQQQGFNSLAQDMCKRFSVHQSDEKLIEEINSSLEGWSAAGLYYGALQDQ